MATNILEPGKVPQHAAAAETRRSVVGPHILSFTALLVAIGFLPLLFLHIWGLLGRPHYQFIALLPVAIWLLVSDRDKSSEENWRHGTWALLGLVLGLAGLAYATRAWSPFLAAVSAVACAPSFLWLLGGVDAFRKWSPAWVMCWIAIPLPFGMDEDLIRQLRVWTTIWSSQVLDQIGVDHLTRGNVVEMPVKSLFIADACSGIHSLYVLLGAALFLGLWFRRSWLHIILLLAAAGGVVMIENVARIVAVAQGLQVQMDLSEGRNHSLLGFALFIASLLLLFSFDRLIHFMVGRGELWGETPFAKSRRATLDLRLCSLLCLVGLGFVPLGAYQAFAMKDRMPRVSDIVEQDIVLPELGSAALPEKIGRFEQKDFTTVKRVHGDPFGQASQQWIYSSGGTTLQISVDYPYQGIHDLCVCYSQTGWQVHGQQVVTGEQLRALSLVPQADVAMGRLYKDLEGEGLLLFSLCDLQGQEIAVIKELARGAGAERVTQRFDALNADPAAAPSERTLLQPPYLQFHLQARTTTELNTQLIDEIMQFFLSARAELKLQCLKSARQQGGLPMPSPASR